MKIMLATEHGTVFGKIFKDRVVITMMSGVECKIDMDLGSFQYEFNPSAFAITVPFSKVRFIVDSNKNQWSYRIDDKNGTVMYDPERNISMSSADALMYFFVKAQKMGKDFLETCKKEA